MVYTLEDSAIGSQNTAEKKGLNREEDITWMLGVTAMEGYLMEGYDSREPFSLKTAVLISTRRTDTVKNLGVTALQCILTPLFTKVDIFDLVVPYLFTFLFVRI